MDKVTKFHSSMDLGPLSFVFVQSPLEIFKSHSIGAEKCSILNKMKSFMCMCIHKHTGPGFVSPHMDTGRQNSV